MRYLLSTSFSNELTGRLSYLYDVFHQYYLSKESKGFIKLKPIGYDDLPVLFIVGHNNSVYEYLKENVQDIKENVIVLITCVNEDVYSLLPSSITVYATNQISSHYSGVYNGKEYGFSFDITESELRLHNSCEQNILKRINDTFYLIKKM